MVGGVSQKGIAAMTGAPLPTGPAPDAEVAPKAGISGMQAAMSPTAASKLEGVETVAKMGRSSELQDSSKDPTGPKFGTILNQIQQKYGAKPEKPREIKKTLGKDDFLKIMITQMKHQDPTSPFKAEQFASEMAQFTSVEQMQNMNQNLSKMLTQNQPLERMTMTSLIGKTVTIDRDRFSHSEGTGETLNFTLPKDAHEVKLSVLAESGETVFEKDLGELKAGENSFYWEGNKTNQLPVKSGNYMMSIKAQDEKGVNIAISAKNQAKIIGVSFEGPEPLFLVGDPKKPDKVSMKNLSRIEEGLGMVSNLIPGAKSLGNEPQNPIPESKQQVTSNEPANAKNPAYFSFKKGVGSETLPDNSVQSLKLPSAPEEKGFPNGLHSE